MTSGLYSNWMKEGAQVTAVREEENCRAMFPTLAPTLNITLTSALGEMALYSARSVR